MTAVGHIARARASTTRRPSCRCRRSTRIRTRRRRSGATAIRIPPGAELRRFRRRRVLDAITPRTRLIFLNTPNNPTGQLIAARRHRSASPRPRRTPSCSWTRPISSSAATAFLPRAGAAPERARRPHVLQGVRPRRHACRHADRAAAGARCRARGDAAVQHQRRRHRRDAGGARRLASSCRATPREVARVARASLRRLPAARPRLLAERRQLRAGARRRSRRTVRRGAGGAASTCAIARRIPPRRLHPRHRRRPRTHRRGDRGARVGRAGRRHDEPTSRATADTPAPRQRRLQPASSAAPVASPRRRAGRASCDDARARAAASIGRPPRRRSRAADASTARASTTSAPASASSITCSSCSRGTAAST